MTRYAAENGEETGFRLWQNYRMDQVQLKLLKNPGYTAVGTYYYDDVVVIFASLKKDLAEADKLNYKDKFLEPALFQWESMANLPKSDLAKLNSSTYTHLFIRKVADENGIVLPFTYVGKGKLTNCRATENGNGTAVTVIKIRIIVRINPNGSFFLTTNLPAVCFSCTTFSTRCTRYGSEVREAHWRSMPVCTCSRIFS